MAECGVCFQWQIEVDVWGFSGFVAVVRNSTPSCGTMQFFAVALQVRVFYLKVVCVLLWRGCIF